MLDTYLPRTQYESYEDFIENFTITVPESFNYAYDVADEIALREPDRVAVIWCDDKGNEAVFTFGQLKRYSDKAASFFRSAGIGKGDPVMLILKRRYEFWFCLLALHKLGAIAIPATHLLTSKDIIYRCNAADIKMVVAVNDPDVLRHVEDAVEKSPTLQSKAVLDTDRDGWLNFSAELEKASDEFQRPEGEDRRRKTTISPSSISPPGPPACPRWSGMISPIPWGISSRRNTGSASAKAGFTSPSPTPGGPRPSGERSTASG